MDITDDDGKLMSHAYFSAHETIYNEPDVVKDTKLNSDIDDVVPE